MPFFFRKLGITRSSESDQVTADTRTRGVVEEFFRPATSTQRAAIRLGAFSQSNAADGLHAMQRGRVFT